MKILLKNCSLDFMKFYFEPKHYAETAFVNNTFLYSKTGETGDSSGYSTTDYINIKGATTIKMSAIMGNKYGGGISFYDESKKFISSFYNIEGFEAEENAEYTVPSIPVNATYIRVCAMTSGSYWVDLA